MDALTSFASGHLASKLVDGFAKNFHTYVIERWSKQKAARFFDIFCLEIARELKSMGSGKVETLLEDILESEEKSEILFDAYRRVALSRSREIGPRIIAVLTAQLILKERSPYDAEEIIFSVAEQLNDEELLGFAEYIRKHQEKMSMKIKTGRDNKDDETYIDNNSALVIWHAREQIDSGWSREKRFSVSPINYADELGGWAVKMKYLGVFHDEIIEKHWDYQADPERHVDEDGSVRELTWWITVQKPFIELVDLIERFGDQ